MPISFPASLDSLVNPAGTDKTNVVLHSVQHANANDAIEALEVKVGVDASSVTSSHDYKLSAVIGADKAAPLTSPTFTGTVTVPTPAANDNTTKAASTAFVQTELAELIASAPAALDTLFELADALANDPAFATTMTTALSGKASTTHATTHQNGGSDEINVTGLSGLLGDAQTPLAHATSHKSGGSDAIKIDELEATTDITTLDATTTKHGLMPKGTGSTATFYRSDMTQAAPTASVAISEANIPFTDGDTMRRVTISDAAVTAASKIIGTIRRPDTTDDSADRGYLYIANVVECVSGAFDLLISALGWGFDDPTANPPNETVKFLYQVA